MIGPFSSPPFPSFRISPIGIATRKYNSAAVDIINKGRSHSLDIMQFIQIQILGSRFRSPSNSDPTVFSHHLQLTPQLEHLVTASRDSILNSVTPRTLSSYLTGWKCFKAPHNLPFPTLDVLTFTNFITFAHSIQKIKSSTIQVYLSGINFLVKISSGSPCPALAHAHINMLLKGLRKAKPRPTPKRLLLTSDLLARCIETLRKGYLSPSTDKVLESMFLLAFFGFLHCSEFTASTLLYDPSRHPSLSDISVLSSDTLIYFLKRKTGRVATRSWFHHHFRQILLRSGIPDNITKILGRWASTAYLAYVRNDLNDIRNAHTLLST
ncbi:hypothetical protein D5F01_LYC06126 [Larimichthys crocea]|uniref:Core-binding (CB) domain-containing protein n=1 Tax=Larimichthys crocea TaxID=215358 RepID=A0A6G0IUT3_LARCR|nr:hypothetical protein D5F01_LYC06126 [Larimichthys crocea]